MNWGRSMPPRVSLSRKRGQSMSLYLPGIVPSSTVLQTTPEETRMPHQCTLDWFTSGNLMEAKLWVKGINTFYESTLHASYLCSRITDLWSDLTPYYHSVWLRSPSGHAPTLQLDIYPFWEVWFLIFGLCYYSWLTMMCYFQVYKKWFSYTYTCTYSI